MSENIPFTNAHSHHPGGQYSVFNLFADNPDATSLPRFSIGVHPWYAENRNEESIRQQIWKAASQPGLCAIGECGLDRLRGPEMAQQEKVFAAQIELSEEMGLPLILHCVRASERLLHLHKKTAPRQQWIFHGFNLRISLAEKMLAAGLMLSFGSAILQQESAAASALAACPSDRFLLETDDAEGKIEEIYATAAIIRKLSLEEMKERVWMNWKTTFLQKKETNRL